MTLRARLGWMVVVVAVLAGAAFAGYQQLFSTFAFYDDEGFLMISLRTFLEGAPLYDETYTQYGPVPYLLHGAVHEVFGLPIDHRVGRFKTLVLWLASAALCGVLLLRLTGSRALALVAGVAAFHHLDRFAAEPGHPQELLTLGLLAVAVMVSKTETRGGRRVALAAVGAIVGLALLSKANVGLFLGLAVALAAVHAVRRGTLRNLGAVLLAGVCMLMPVALLAPRLGTPSGLLLAVVLSLSMVAVLVVAFLHCPGGDLEGEDLLLLAAVGTGTVVVIAILTVALGTSVSGLWTGLVGQHLGFVSSFFITREYPLLAAPLACVGVIVAVWAARRPARIAPWFRLTVGCAMVSAPVVAHLVEAFRPLTSGLQDRGLAAGLMVLATPCAWLVILPGRGNHAKPALGREVLALLAVLLPLGAFPVAGTQTAVGSVLLILVGLVCIWDGEVPSLRRAVVGVVTVLALSGLICRDVAARSLRASYQELGLPGTKGLRLPPAEARRWRWMSEQLRARADTILFFPDAWNSLFFWTGLEPPTALTATSWPGLLTEAQQRRIISALGRYDRVCAVWVSGVGMPSAWYRAPLTVWMEQNLETVARLGPFEIRSRRGAAHG